MSRTPNSNKKPFTLPSALVALAVALFITVSSNQPLWHSIQALPLNPLTKTLYCVLIALIVVSVLSLIMWLLPHRHLFKAVAIFLLLISSLIGYFQIDFGVVFHLDMYRNIADNLHDKNTNEALELISAPLLIHLTLYWLLPSLAVLATPLSRHSLSIELKHRSLAIMTLAGFIALIFLPNEAEVKEFGREHRNLRAYINPIFPIGAFADYLKRREEHAQRAFHPIGEDAHQATSTHPRTVGIMVVGETARSDHFSLNGYERKTNPRLERRQLVNFPDTIACGTSTKYSVPCMFSFLSAKNYSPEKAAEQSNVLDVLQKAGIKVIWIDNNSSCKGVCERIETINYRKSPNPALPHFGNGEYFDEVLLYRLKDRIMESNQDTLIVLHTLGSHGPAYFKRSPDELKVFQPECRENTYKLCGSLASFVNEYDNSIVYADYFLDKTISLLESLDDNIDTFMLYVSDHGESLGEDGMYLHGADPSEAPDAQMKVPYFGWLSPSFLQHHDMSLAALQLAAEKPTSHDNISHSLLGLMDVETELYDPQLNIFTSTR